MNHLTITMKVDQKELLPYLTFRKVPVHLANIFTSYYPFFILYYLNYHM